MVNSHSCSHCDVEPWSEKKNCAVHITVIHHISSSDWSPLSKYGTFLSWWKCPLLEWFDVNLIVWPSHSSALNPVTTPIGDFGLACYTVLSTIIFTPTKGLLFLELRNAFHHSIIAPWTSRTYQVQKSCSGGILWSNTLLFPFNSSINQMNQSSFQLTVPSM